MHSLDQLITHVLTRPQEQHWQGWHIRPVSGGMNNLLYRVTSGEQDLVVKFTRRDSRDRAGREYAALCALQAHSLDLAPHPILLERDQYALPVVVQRWVDGLVRDEPPATDQAWQALVEYYVAIHQLTPERCTLPLLPAVTNMASVAQGRAMIAEQIALLPVEARPSELMQLAQAVERWTLREPGGSRGTVCRVDANIRNFIQRPGIWASVDWENSGWGEPAFELVDLMTHPAYASVPSVRWDWVVQYYTLLSGDQAAPAKVAAFYPLMLVWWVARSARLLYELPRGLDARLSAAANLHEITRQYQRYVQLASQCGID